MDSDVDMDDGVDTDNGTDSDISIDQVGPHGVPAEIGQAVGEADSEVQVGVLECPLYNLEEGFTVK